MALLDQMKKRLSADLFPSFDGANDPAVILLRPKARTRTVVTSGRKEGKKKKKKRVTQLVGNGPRDVSRNNGSDHVSNGREIGTPGLG